MLARSRAAQPSCRSRAPTAHARSPLTSPSCRGSIATSSRCRLRRPARVAVDVGLDAVALVVPAVLDGARALQQRIRMPRRRWRRRPVVVGGGALVQ